jgi:hypothetical protein
MQEDMQICSMLAMAQERERSRNILYGLDGFLPLILSFEGRVAHRCSSALRHRFNHRCQSAAGHQRYSKKEIEGQ